MVQIKEHFATVGGALKIHLSMPIQSVAQLEYIYIYIYSRVRARSNILVCFLFLILLRRRSIALVPLGLLDSAGDLTHSRLLQS
uniref:Uncharacterized protein n=1 Tax=Physcomitrium patens TaxID=3218 RepID=A0A2K1JGA3_PHYPA|nr:hypothetical protein PHYPA_017974 [Physcomitrium patens]